MARKRTIPNLSAKRKQEIVEGLLAGRILPDDATVTEPQLDELADRWAAWQEEHGRGPVSVLKLTRELSWPGRSGTDRKA